jgi:patatin-like phospholipase/acyl hydrolase
MLAFATVMVTLTRLTIFAPNQADAQMPTYKILSLDGGGIRGVFTAALIKKLQDATQFLDAVDLFAGTSTGALLALALAAELDVQAIIDLYQNQGPDIFKPRGTLITRPQNGLTRAKYTAGPLKEALEVILGDRTLGDLKRKVLVPAFDLDDKNPNIVERSWRARFFHNFPVSAPDTDNRKELILDVAMRTTAAPSYFPSYDGYVDGGVVANSPALAAVAQAVDPSTGGQQLSDLRVVSLGTGINHEYITSPATLDWGVVNWAPYLVDLFMDGAMGVVDYQCMKLLGARYRRLAPVLPGNKAIKLDDTSAIDKLLSYAETISETESFTDLADWVKKRFK